MPVKLYKELQDCKSVQMTHVAMHTKVIKIKYNSQVGSSVAVASLQMLNSHTIVTSGCHTAQPRCEIVPLTQKILPGSTGTGLRTLGFRMETFSVNWAKGIF